LKRKGESKLNQISHKRASKRREKNGESDQDFFRWSNNWGRRVEGDTKGGWKKEVRRSEALKAGLSSHSLSKPTKGTARFIASLYLPHQESERKNGQEATKGPSKKNGDHQIPGVGPAGKGEERYAMKDQEGAPKGNGEYRR